MGVAAIVVGSLATGVAVANALTTRSLWRSSLYETAQKAAQTVLLWAIPGSFVFVMYLLRDPLAADASKSGDPTTNREHGYTDDVPTHSHSSGEGGGHY